MHTFYFCLYIAVLQKLILSGEIQGTLRGQRENSVFIPHVYVTLQIKWMQSFFLANGYLGKIYIIFCSV